jgi:hypothetical protein
MWERTHTMLELVGIRRMVCYVLERQASFLKLDSLIQYNAFLLFGRHTISDFELVEIRGFF